MQASGEWIQDDTVELQVELQPVLLKGQLNGKELHHNILWFIVSMEECYNLTDRDATFLPKATAAPPSYV